MSDAITVKCPECSAKLKLKNRSAVGKKIPCPKCKTTFVVELPTDDDEFADLIGSEDVAAAEDEVDGGESSRLPPARTGRSTTKKTPRKRRAGLGEWKTPLIVGSSVVVLLALLGGVGFLVFPLLAEMLGGNKIDIAWLPPDSEMIVHARVAETWKSPFAQSMMTAPAARQALNLKELLGLDAEEIRSVTFGFTDVALAGRGSGLGAGVPGMNPAGMLAAGRTTAGSPRVLAVLRTTQSFDRKAMKDRLRGVRTVNYQQYELVFIGGVALSGQACFFPDSKTVVMGSEAEVKAAIDRGPKAPRRTELDFIDASRHVVIVVAPKDPAAFESSAPDAGLPLPGVSNLATTLKGKVTGICLGLTFGEDLDWSAAANCTTPDAAQAASAELSKSLESAKGELNKLRSSVPPQFSEIVVLGDTILNSIVVQPHGGVMEAKGKIPASIKNVFDKLPMLMMAGMLGGGPGANAAADGMPSGGPGEGLSFDLGGPPRSDPDPLAPGQVSYDPVLDAGEAARRTQCKNNLKRMGLAMHNFHDAAGTFSASAIRDKSGKALLSWRVAMLPYLDQTDLYKQFHLDEPWDSENNKKLIPLMPALFTCPGGKAQPGMTSYLAAAGPGAIFESGAARKIAEITDGTSNTILLVEVDDSQAVIWTKPDDYTYDPASPMKGLVGHHPAGFLVLTCDGAAHFIAETIDPALLVALFTRSGGEKIPPGILY